MAFRNVPLFRLTLAILATTYLLLTVGTVVGAHGFEYRPSRIDIPASWGVCPDTSVHPLSDRPIPPIAQLVTCYPDQYVPPAELSWDVINWRFEPYIGLAPSELPHVYVPLDAGLAAILLALLWRYRSRRRLTRWLAARWLGGTLAAGYLAYGLALILLNHASVVFPPNGLVADCGQHGFTENCLLPGISYTGPTRIFFAPLWQAVTVPSSIDTFIFRTYYPVDLVVAALILVATIRPPRRSLWSWRRRSR